MYGKIIISEAYLPYEEKTIKPIEGGFAGGTKVRDFGDFFFFFVCFLCCLGELLLERNSSLTRPQYLYKDIFFKFAKGPSSERAQPEILTACILFPG
jgi:hypothetical protein